ncbi:unnamed protein product, partial [Tenebrio molitor]
MVAMESSITDKQFKNLHPSRHTKRPKTVTNLKNIPVLRFGVTIIKSQCL